MSDVIKIKKGLNINLKGKAEKIFVKAEPSQTYAVKPIDFPNLIPKLAIKAGDKVKAGTVLFYDKYKPEVKFTAPVSGSVKEVTRGERRKILEIVVEADAKNEYEAFKQGSASDFSRDDIIANLLNSGVWPSIIERPYGIIANPQAKPKAIFISAFDNGPLPVDFDFIMGEQESDFQAGLDILGKLTTGKVHLNVNAAYPTAKVFANAKGVQLNSFKGSFPASLVGTQIHKTDPINKGEVVWTVSPQNVALIGRLFKNGKYDATKVVALSGSEVLKPRYYKTISGSSIEVFTKDNITEGNHRYISGSVLTGSQIEKYGYVGYYDSSICVIPEGDIYEFFGWIAPGLNKFSMSRTFPSWLMPKKEYTINTNLQGGKRALMITGAFEKVFPFDILPMQLIKAIKIQDIDLMEKLGVYEVVPEDFALCEFVDTSKTDIQALVRDGLSMLLKEMN